MKPTIALMDSNYRFVVFDGSHVPYESRDSYEKSPEIKRTLDFMTNGKISAASGYGLLNFRDEQKGVAVELTPEKLVIAAPIDYVDLEGRSSRRNEGVAFYIKDRGDCTNIIEELKFAHNEIFEGMNPKEKEPLVGNLKSAWLESVYQSVAGVSASYAAKTTEHPESIGLSVKPLIVDYNEILNGAFDTKTSSRENQLFFFATSDVVPATYRNNCDVIVT